MKSSLGNLSLKQVSRAFFLTAVVPEWLELQILWLLKSSFSGGCCILASSLLHLFIIFFIFGEMTTHLGTIAATSNLILPLLRKRGRTVDSDNPWKTFFGAVYLSIQITAVAVSISGTIYIHQPPALVPDLSLSLTFHVCDQGISILNLDAFRFFT